MVFFLHFHYRIGRAYAYYLITQGFFVASVWLIDYKPGWYGVRCLYSGREIL